jgi:hypothetical protein
MTNPVQFSIAASLSCNILHGRFKKPYISSHCDFIAKAAIVETVNDSDSDQSEFIEDRQDIEETIYLSPTINNEEIPPP